MEYWIWLRLIKGLGPILKKRLLAFFGSPEEIYKAEEIDLLNVDGIGGALANTIISSRSLDKAYQILEECNKKNIKLLTYNDSLYPAIAKEYNYAPSLLYYRGTIKADIEGVAIVGSRRCSTYGKELALEAGGFLAQNNIPVISSMAKGIDSYAHISCIKNGGYTIAFLGCGVDICYPSEHRDLMEAIIDKGAVVSEYLPSTKARTEYFPKRNGLISSWSRKVLLVEASEKSGALITADFAKEFGREVYVPPHEINSNSGKDSNKLLLEGAKVFLEPSQLLFDKETSSKKETVNPEKVTNKLKKKEDRIENRTLRDLSPLEEKILACISNESKSIDVISMETKIDQVKLIESLSEMEFRRKSKGCGWS